LGKSPKEAAKFHKESGDVDFTETMVFSGRPPKKKKKGKGGSGPKICAQSHRGRKLKIDTRGIKLLQNKVKGEQKGKRKKRRGQCQRESQQEQVSVWGEKIEVRP